MSLSCTFFQINVGLIHRPKGVLKTVRGKQLPISVPAGADAPCVLAEAVRKHTAYNHIDSEDVYHLLYPSFLEVITLPGTSDPFTVDRYAKDSGRNYARVTLYLCPQEDFLDLSGEINWQ